MDKPASSWRGRVVGTYSTDLTREGYAVESDTEKGSVQIYPAKALRLATPANGEQVERAGWRVVPVDLTPEMLDATCATEADDTAMRAAWLELLRTAPKPPTPTEDARSRVKVLEEALAEARRMSFAAASIPEGYIDGWADCVEHIRNATVLGNKETDRHG